MTSVMLTGCPFSTRMSRRLINLNRRNGDFLPVGRLCLRTTTASGRGRTLSIRSSSDTAMVIDEKAVSVKMMREIKIEASRMEESIGAVACLAVILFGNRQDSARFRLPCGIVGIRTFIVRLPQDSSEEKVLSHVSRLNNDPCVHGILVQSPLPPHMDEHNILNAVSVEKDVEGFHPLNIGLLAMRGREPLFVPRAPQGCMELLHRYNFEIQGKRAVVIGKHNMFDMTAALLLQREGATVSIIHSRTKNPEEITRQADIVFSAVGQPNMVRGSWIKPGAVVINVGFTLVRDPNVPHGFRYAGDICHEEVRKVASAITPAASDFSSAMPLAMLLSNTLTSAKRKHNFMYP